jgi:hypothetical protein
MKEKKPRRARPAPRLLTPEEAELLDTAEYRGAGLAPVVVDALEGYGLPKKWTMAERRLVVAIFEADMGRFGPLVRILRAREPLTDVGKMHLGNFRARRLEARLRKLGRKLKGRPTEPSYQSPTDEQMRLLEAVEQVRERVAVELLSLKKIHPQRRRLGHHRLDEIISLVAQEAGLNSGTLTTYVKKGGPGGLGIRRTGRK